MTLPSRDSSGPVIRKRCWTLLLIANSPCGGAVSEVSSRPRVRRSCSFVNDQLLRTLGLEETSLTAPPHGLFAISKSVQHRFLITGPDESRDGKVILGEDYSWISRYPVVK